MRAAIPSSTVDANDSMGGAVEELTCWEVARGRTILAVVVEEHPDGDAAKECWTRKIRFKYGKLPDFPDKSKNGR